MPHVTFVLKNNQEVDLTPKGLDAADMEKPYFGVPVWSSSDTGVLTINPSADGLTAVARAVVGAVGVAVVTATAFADKELTKPIEGHIDMDVQAVVEPATRLDLVPGEPRDQGVIVTARR